MLEAESDVRLEYDNGETRPEYRDNYRNGCMSKTLKTNEGKLEISVPQKPCEKFDLRIIPKYSRNI
ncbi:MAG: transposase [Deferribacteraceae bacterium]|jgi:transposase-like protein|nr:transposase [Deferribacteraceae bacterium]